MCVLQPAWNVTSVAKMTFDQKETVHMFDDKILVEPTKRAAVRQRWSPWKRAPPRINHEPQSANGFGRPAQPRNMSRYVGIELNAVRFRFVPNEALPLPEFGRVIRVRTFEL